MAQIDDILQQHGRSLVRQAGHYYGAGHKESTSYHGYVAFKSVINNLTGRYNVIVPRMNNALLTDVPIITTFAQANGVGYAPPALRPGQPVIVRFNDKSSAQPYIDGSLFVVGNTADYKEKPPGIDDVHSRSGNAINPLPLTAHSLSVGGEASSEVHPMIIREFSKVHGANSPAGIEIPGVSETIDSFGNVTRIIPGQSIEILNNAKIEEVLGADGSLVDASLKSAKEAFTRSVKEWWKQDQFYVTYTSGIYRIGEPHPKKNENMNITATDPKNMEGLSKLSKFLDQAMGYLTNDFKVVVQQVKYVIQTYERMRITVKSLWGEEALGSLNVGSEGVPSLSFNEVLSFLPPDISRLANQAAQLYTTLSKYINGLPPLPGISGDSGTIVTSLSPRVAKLQALKAEGQILFGAIMSLIDLIALATKRGQSLNQQEGEDQTQTVLRIRQLVVQEEQICRPVTPITAPSNILQESSTASDLSYNLSFLGVPQADLLVENLQTLVQTPNIISFIGAVSNALPPNLQLATVLTSVQLGSDQSIPLQLEELRANADPTSTFCGDLAESLYFRAESLVPGAITTADLKAVYSYLFVPEPNPQDWVKSPSSFASWIKGLNREAGERAELLLSGDVDGFLFKTVEHHTGVDLDLYPIKKRAVSVALHKVLGYSAQEMPI